MNIGDLVKNTNIPSISSKVLLGVVVDQKESDGNRETCKVLWSDTEEISGWLCTSQIELIEEI